MLSMSRRSSTRRTVARSLRGRVRSWRRLKLGFKKRFLADEVQRGEWRFEQPHRIEHANSYC